MITFQSQDMQKQASALQEAAMREPVLITYHDRPRLVLMSMEEYDRLRGRKGRNTAVASLSDEAAGRIASLPNKATRDFLIAYSRTEISRREAMDGIGMEPTDTVAFASLMNSEGIPWPKVDRERAERQADGLLELIGGESEE
jgi:prevent-host-death family protein